MPRLQTARLSLYSAPIGLKSSVPSAVSQSMSSGSLRSMFVKMAILSGALSVRRSGSVRMLQ